MMHLQMVMISVQGVVLIGQSHGAFEKEDTFGLTAVQMYAMSGFNESGY
jgi:hypothetical protein